MMVDEADFQRDVTSLLSFPDATVVEEVKSRYDDYHHGLELAAQSGVIPTTYLGSFCVVGASDEGTQRICDIDATVRESSNHLVAREVLPAAQAIASLPGEPD